MSQPMGYYRRKDRGPRGWLARWWLKRRTRIIAEQLERKRDPRP